MDAWSVEVSRVDLTDLPPRGDHHVAIDDAIPLYFHVALK